MRSLCALLVPVCLLGACMAAPTPAMRLADSARELNLAARFGRMDVAVGHAQSAVRDDFLKRRSNWGNEIRVVDVGVTGMSFQDEHNANVMVDIAWVRMNEGELRNTRLEQEWSDDDGGWQLTREHRIAGDVGLFGEKVVIVRAEPRGDVHFPSKTIR